MNGSYPASASELADLLDHLIDRWENEVVEFKQVTDNYSTSDIGKYFSALANEANLRSMERAWLIFGVDNRSRSVVGSTYREDSQRLHNLKMQIADDTEPSITFRNIFEVTHPNGRVLLFEIPAAPRGIPIAWKGHYYARAGESLVSLGLDKQDEIRRQTLAGDWSAQVVPNAIPAHLDESAIQKARESFAQKYADRFPRTDVMNWPLPAFLNRARLAVDGSLTRTTILLLGKAESAHLLLPHPAQMTWKLEGAERALMNTSGLLSSSIHPPCTNAFAISRSASCPMMPC